jgi:hypothetical protein
MPHASLVRTCAAIALPLLIGAAAGCSERANPVRPSAISVAGLAASSTGGSGTISLAQISAGHITPADLVRRGWTCFTPPVPNRIVCSHPNQGFPTVGDPPPEDRPATFEFFAFDGDGNFVGPEFLIRSDLYHEQVCEATGQPYVFVPIIGYYECVHVPGRG